MYRWTKWVIQSSVILHDVQCNTLRERKLRKINSQKEHCLKLFFKYNCHFSSVKGLHVTHKVATKKFLPLLRIFNNKLHPQSMKSAYVSIFTIDKWKALPEEEKQIHTIRNCEVCNKKYVVFSKAFPSPKRRGKKPVVVPKSTATINLLREIFPPLGLLAKKCWKSLTQSHKGDFENQGKMCLVETPKSHNIYRNFSN